MVGKPRAITPISACLALWVLAAMESAILVNTLTAVLRIVDAAMDNVHHRK
jgi:hypothetical protein